MNKTLYATYAVSGLLVSTCIFSCKKDIANEAQLSSQTTARTFVGGTNAINFDQAASGAYNESQYISDFGNNSSNAWNNNNTRAGIYYTDGSNVLYTTLLKDKLDSECG